MGYMESTKRDFKLALEREKHHAHFVRLLSRVMNLVLEHLIACQVSPSPPRAILLIVGGHLIQPFIGPPP